MIGQKVTHKIFGTGVVKAIDEDKNSISVEFEKDQHKRSNTFCFPYPRAFREFLTAADEDVQKALLAKLDKELSITEVDE